jgi:hypothetical protein
MDTNCGVYVHDSQDVAQTYDIEITGCDGSGSCVLLKQSLGKQDVLERFQRQFKLTAVESARFLAKPEETRVLANWPVSDEVLADYGALECCDGIADGLLEGELRNPAPDTSDYNKPATFGTLAGEQLDKALNKK